MDGAPSKAVTSKDRMILGGALVAVVLAAFCSHDRFGPIVAFLTAAIALSLLAVVVGHATDHLGNKMSPGATGVIQSALGNLPELMVCIFSLRAGLVDVVKGALVGSIVANSLLVLGMAFLFGGLKNGTQKFKSEPPKMIAVLMFLAVAAMLIPSMAHMVHTPAEPHETTLSGVCSVVLLIVFACSATFFFKGSPEVVPKEAHGHATWPIAFTMVVLALAGLGAAFVSEWFVDALKPATTAMGLSEAFTGFVVVAVAGNTIEHLAGVSLMVKNKPDYAVSVVLNGSLQIALVLVPVLVLVSLAFFAATPMTLVLTPMLMIALILSALVPALIVFDGESIWLEGVALVGLYVLIAASFWWG